MNAGDLHVFAAVARAGGMGRAARDLGTVQSNVTARVRALEDDVGRPLFHRHSRGVTLTGAGERLLPYAAQIGRLLDEAQRVARDDGVRGPLTVGSLETTAALRLPPVLAAYHRRYPDVDVALETGTTASLVADVLAWRLEGAFVAGPVAHAELVEEPVVEEELVLVTAAAAPAPLTRAAAGLKVVVFRAGCSYRQRLEALLAAQGVVAARRLEFGTLDGILGCVAAGVGVTLLPRAVVEPARRAGRVAVHALPRRTGRVQTVFVRRRDGYASRALLAFIEAATSSAASRRAR